MRLLSSTRAASPGHDQSLMGAYAFVLLRGCGLIKLAEVLERVGVDFQVRDFNVVDDDVNVV